MFYFYLGRHYNQDRNLIIFILSTNNILFIMSCYFNPIPYLPHISNLPVKQHPCFTVSPIHTPKLFFSISNLKCKHIVNISAYTYCQFYKSEVYSSCLWFIYYASVFLIFYTKDPHTMLLTITCDKFWLKPFWWNYVDDMYNYQFTRYFYVIFNSIFFN